LSDDRSHAVLVLQRPNGQAQRREFTSVRWSPSLGFVCDLPCCFIYLKSLF
jgi:hypothetical protein